MEEPKPQTSLKEERIRKITQLYYSRPDVQNAILEFSRNRETVPRYFEGFGKRPDTLQYPSDILELVKKGATSFHCSQELWSDPLQIETGMSSKAQDQLRDGWDLLIDIDSKYLDYSKVSAELIAESLKFHGIKNFAMKFSGSKGFHIIVPWSAFPTEVNKVKTSDMFPEWPRIISKYLTQLIEPKLIERITALSTESKYVKDFEVPKQVMPDIILVSSRHLFRAPYSLHEKTALSSIVLSEEELKNFEPQNADPIKVKIKEFYPEAEEGEATELLVQALDWHKAQAESGNTEESKTGEYSDSQRTQPTLKLENLSDKFFSPSIIKILSGVADGKKRALFILINLFRSLGMEKEELEKRINEWNSRNEQPLQEGYIRSQLIWSYRHKIVLPPNYDKDHYKGIGIIPTEEELRYKNPVNYTAKKFFAEKVRKPKTTKKVPKTK